jgi:CheY-like chemotaxis protein
LVLLDINMPKKNGFEVLRWLRADPVVRRLSVTMLTASLRPEDVDLAFDLGANSYLVKPSTLESLADMLRTLRDWMEINHFATATGGNGVTIELTPKPDYLELRLRTPLPSTRASRVGL